MTGDLEEMVARTPRAGAPCAIIGTQTPKLNGSDPEAYLADVIAGPATGGRLN